MRPLVKFAGHDPEENDFTGVEMAPLHDQDRKRRSNSIDGRRAAELKEFGMSWVAIGRELAAEMGRTTAFQSTSVAIAAMPFMPKRGVA